MRQDRDILSRDGRRDGRAAAGGRLVVGMAGEAGLPYGVRLLERLRELPLEVHLVLTEGAEAALGDELARVQALADQTYAPGNQAARISSGSFLTRGMVVAPCDGAALAAISMGLATNLVFRAADVTLKERRPLVLGLEPAPPTAVERANLDRAARVPGLVVLPLAGDPDEAASSLLAQLDGAGDRSAA